MRSPFFSVSMYSVKFSVTASVKDDEFVGLVGSNQELGNWKLQNSKILTNDSTSKIWKIEIKFSKQEKVQYRYFIGQLTENGMQQRYIVHRWECHMKGRWFEAKDGMEISDKFGIVDCIEKVDQGWLCGQTEVNINVSEVNGEPCFNWIKKDADLRIEDLKISCTVEGAIKSEMTFLSPYSANHFDPNCSVNMPHGKEKYFSYAIQVLKLEDLTVKFDIFNSSDNLLGQGWVLGSLLEGSIGVRKLVVTGIDGRPIGILRIEYVVIRPYRNEKMTLEETYSLHWKPRETLHIGHRGAGNSFTAETVSNLHENTISSFLKASEHGAAMIEFDVQLTKDKIPIIYHDLNLCVAIGQDANLHEVQIQSMTYDELKKYNLRHKSRKNSNR